MGHRDTEAQRHATRRRFAALLPPGVILLTGAARVAPRLPGEITTRFFNALQIVADDGQITGTYDKPILKTDPM